jgi:hydrogenase-4 component B
MDPIQLLLLAVTLYGIGAIASLFLNGFEDIARRVSGGTGVVASLIGAASAVLALAGASSQPLTLPGPSPFGSLVIQMDPLSAGMVGVISLLSAASSLYSISYLKEYSGRGLGTAGFFYNLFIAAMLLVVTVANAFYFLFFWELMTLTSYFLVIFEQEKKENLKAGYLYMLMAHAGTALIMLAFLVFFMSAGSFNFSDFRQVQLSPAARDLIFLMAFFGFGIKAGIVPFHIWLPRAHPAAPSHVSALLSGVMIKTAIYGIIRVSVDFLGANTLWWGFLVLSFGAISALLGVSYALVERDIKRLLAYSSVENIGIILMGVGVGMIGMATGNPVLAMLGFLAAFYHLVNHAFFKGLLFLGAGSVVYRLHTKNMNEMGGLARRMPWTGLAFLFGALAVSAIPPLNGFVSEWFTFQALFTAAGSQLLVSKVFAPLFAVVLSITGALAAMCFIKAYGSAFAGPARSPAARETRESPGGMVASMIFLVVGILALGLGAPAVTPTISNIAASIANVEPLAAANGMQVFPINIAQAALSPLLMALLLIGLLSLPILIVAILGGYRAGRRSGVDPWSCGYGYTEQMSVSASSFDQPMQVTFRFLYTLRLMVKKFLDAIASLSGRATSVISRVEPVIENFVTRPLERSVEYLGEHIRVLQMGDIRVYCLYIILTLAILLIVGTR